MSFKTDQESLRKWFLAAKRDLPWRQNPTPYSVLISEVMLQQTKADVVVDYFKRWMQQFPTVFELAEAPIESVLKAWEGLGYYSRARNLHKAAKSLLMGFPIDYDGWIQVSGIGPYTANAILSFAYHQPVIAMDANVQRVLSRYFETLDLKKAEQDAKTDLSSQNPQDIAEGLIELGALICTKKPFCELCPLKKGCRSFLNKTTEQYPAKKILKKTKSVHKKVILYQYEDRFGLYRAKPGELFADLYRFYELDVDEDGYQQLIGKNLEHPFKEVRATATSFRFFLFPCLEKTPHKIHGLEFFTLTECLKLPFTSGHKRILHQLVAYSEKKAHKNRSVGSL
ncbi:MAG: A/G-specific adenine glycosylase [Chlamydiae bacterium]|nr:A/G-specific adenine glycosylase [Chlamydiota bacterium]